jgi:hypothetical protein
MYDNKRKLERKYLTYFSRVLDRRTNKLLGYLFDLTIEGAMVVGEVELPVGTKLLARIDLPEGLCPNKYLDIEAIVVWSRLDEEDSTYKAGLKLADMPPESVEMLDCLIDHFGMAV